MVVSKKAASKRAPAQSAPVCFQRHHGNDAVAVADESNIYFVENRSVPTRALAMEKNLFLAFVRA